MTNPPNNRVLLLKSDLDYLVALRLSHCIATMEYLIRFIQMHEEFRKPEIESIAELLNIKFHWVSYIESVGLPIL